MELTALVKQKNKELTVQSVALQQHLSARATTPDFRSFLITFVAIPFILGAMARFLPGNVGVTTRHFVRAFLRGLRFWPIA